MKLKRRPGMIISEIQFFSNARIKVSNASRDEASSKQQTGAPQQDQGPLSVDQKTSKNGFRAASSADTTSNSCRGLVLITSKRLERATGRVAGAEPSARPPPGAMQLPSSCSCGGL